MEPGSEPKRAARRKEKAESANWATKTVALENMAHSSLEKSAKKLKMSKAKFASAAILYFTETGLDPTKEQPKGLANVSDKVGQDTRAIRVQNVDIANRLIGIIRAWEKTLYGFMQLQQGATLNYLEQIEKNILSHQVAVETNLLSPLIEQVIRGRLESYIARVLAEKTNLQVTEGKQANWLQMNGDHNGERDQLLVKALREFITTNSVPAPKLSVKPGVPAAPAKAVATPAPGAAPTPAPGATTPAK
jgi:hypothetical protein